jgi:nitric oxide reductase NorD protein
MKLRTKFHKDSEHKDVVMKREPVGNTIFHSYELLASALSGRALQVVQGIPGEPAWTDGKSIFIDASLGEREQITALLIQASLLSAGSLAPDVLRKIARHSTLAARYLAIEAHRALIANEALLPPFMYPLLNRGIAARSDSPAASLATALSRELIADPPQSFGVIHAKVLLAANAAAGARSQSQSQVHSPYYRQQELAELSENDEADDGHDRGAAVDMFSVGGTAGILGRWLQRFLSAVRQGGADGTPGTDVPTHRTRNTKSRGGVSVTSTATLDVGEEVAQRDAEFRYPEWDRLQRRYRPNWCTVEEIDPPQKEAAQFPAPATYGLRKPLARLGLGLNRSRRQMQGDDIDIDAAIGARIEMMAGSMPDEKIYVDSLRRRRDLSVLILLDISGSAAEPGTQGQTLHEQQRAAAAALVSALQSLGDRVALYAYNSRGRSSVQLYPVKRFDDHFNSLSMRRLFSLEPGAYSRLGAAIRHGAAVLEAKGGTSRRLLLVLSDGLAYDHGYELEYGAADARRALTEARGRGTGGLCLTMSDSADAKSLRRVFGSTAHATISKPSQLGEMIGALFLSALRSAEVKRRISQRRGSVQIQR